MIDMEENLRNVDPQQGEHTEKDPAAKGKRSATGAETIIAIDMGDILHWKVDPQHDFMLGEYTENGHPTKGKLYVPGAEAILVNEKAITDRCMQYNVRIGGSADQHTIATKELTRNGGIWPEHCMDKTLGQAYVPESLLPGNMVGIVSWMENYSPKQLSELLAKPQVILTKNTYNVFAPKEEGGSPYMGAFLATVEPGAEIVISGVATDYCVADALRGWIAWAEKNGGTVILVSDAVKEIAKEGKEKILAECSKSSVFSAMTTKELLAKLDNAYGLKGAMTAKIEPTESHLTGKPKKAKI